MIIYDNKEFRNLVEQVQYLTNYHDVNQGLVQWGIKVIGQVENASELPTPYDGDYGDAIAVGTEAPFFFYIWTRASIDGDPAYWFPFGEISIMGPQGPQGPQGEKGDTGESTKWKVGYAPQVTGNEKIGDMALDVTNGNVYSFMANQWVYATNIKGPQGLRGVQGLRGEQGPQGIQGPKGDTGDTGGLVNIAGILDNMNQLPTPESLDNTSIAYLVGASDPRDLYIQVGTDPATAQWQNIGPINTATLVFVNGEAQNIWDANTKVDKLPFSTSLARVYVENTSGQTIGYGIDDGNCSAYRLAEYKPMSDGVNAPAAGNKGSLLAPDPQNPYQVATKNYVDSNYVAKATDTSSFSRVYARGANGEDYMQVMHQNANGGSLALRGQNGILKVGTPTENDHAVNKGYADTTYVKKPTVAVDSVIVEKADGTIEAIEISGYPRRETIAWRGGSGGLKVADPIAEDEATTKKYVDKTEKYSTVELSFGTGTMVDTSTLTTSKVYKLNVFTNRNTELVKTDETKITIEDPVEIIGTLRYHISSWLFQGYAIKSDNTIFTFSETNISKININDLTGLTPYYRLVEIA